MQRIIKADKKAHTHKYLKTQFKTSETLIFRCMKAGCSHFLYEPMIVGKFSECWRCGEDFLITKKTIANKKLHCPDCTWDKHKKIKPAVESQVEGGEEIFSDFITSLNEIPEDKHGERE